MLMISGYSIASRVESAEHENTGEITRRHQGKRYSGWSETLFFREKALESIRMMHSGIFKGQPVPSDFDQVRAEAHDVR